MNALVAMSGGVDSSVAAFLTLQAGYPCVGATMQLADMATDAIADAACVASHLGIAHHVFDFTELFQKAVIKPFIQCYEQGGTPNPCICCNRHIKFDALLQAALTLGCSHIVTGHYARIRHDEATGRYLLYKATDLAKDQSYFLSRLSQEQLSHTLLPLGELTKAQVRQVAAEQGFSNARKRDSQDICFIPDGDYFAFMEHYTGKCYPAGDFLDLQGNIVGKHKSAVGYTLGQRKGLGLAMGTPVYVCGKDMENNTVTVGPEEALFATTLIAEDWQWFPFPALTEPLRVTAKARYRHIAQPATVYPEENGQAKVVFDAPQRAITPGQTVTLYQDDMVIGGGTITKVF